jgi:hypothetical protein
LKLFNCSFFWIAHKTDLNLTNWLKLSSKSFFCKSKKNPKNRYPATWDVRRVRVKIIFIDDHVVWYLGLFEEFISSQNYCPKNLIILNLIKSFQNLSLISEPFRSMFRPKRSWRTTASQWRSTQSFSIEFLIQCRPSATSLTFPQAQNGWQQPL